MTSIDGSSDGAGPVCGHCGEDLPALPTREDSYSVRLFVRAFLPPRRTSLTGTANPGRNETFRERSARVSSLIPATQLNQWRCVSTLGALR